MATTECIYSGGGGGNLDYRPNQSLSSGFNPITTNFKPKYVSYAYIYNNNVVALWVDFVNEKVYQNYGTNRQNDITGVWYGSSKYIYLDGNTVYFKPYPDHPLSNSIDVFIYG